MLAPRVNFTTEDGHVGDSAVETLLLEDAQFGLGHVEPTAVFGCIVELEAFHQATCFIGGKGLVEGSGLVGIEVVVDQYDFVGLGKVHIAEPLKTVRVVDPLFLFGGAHRSPTFQRRYHHEEGAHAVALIFAINAFGLSGLHGQCITCFLNQLLGGFIQANQRSAWIVWAMVDLQDILHCADELGTLLGPDAPLLS